MDSAAVCWCCAEDNKISITDLNSTNGTVVNGQELTPMDDLTVGVGSEVIFGKGQQQQQQQ